MNNLTEYSGKRILVTGASGFIGSQLCSRLLEFGMEIHGVSRNSRPKIQGSIHWWTGDLADMSVVRNILTDIKPDLVFHLASHVVGARDLNQVLPTFYSNLASTVNLLTVLTELGCQRIILVGSLEEPSEEDIPAIPSSPYAAAKWACSGYARMFHALYQTPVAWARLFMVYGPGQQDLSKLVPYVTLSLLRGEVPKLTSGERQVDWIYVDDVVEGLIAMARARNINGRTFDFGSGILTSVKSVVYQISEIAKSGVEPLFGSIAERPMEQVRVANVERTNSCIGWKPRISLERGLKYTVDWYRNAYIEI